jgi:hypothetical protein
MKKRSLIIILLALSVGFISVNAKATLDSNTIATFDDPSTGSGDPLFTVDFLGVTLNGGWDDEKTGLTLEIPYSGYTVANGNAFQDAWFEMDEVEITSTYVILGMMCGDTGGGEINFYADGDSNSTDPLLTIGFESGLVSRGNFGSGDTDEEGTFVAEKVTISGIGITPGSLTDEFFSFAFANLEKLPGYSSLNDGFTATAAFTSSAIPEPATICILGFGALSLIRRKK